MSLMADLVELRIYLEQLKGTYGDDYTNASPMPVGTMLKLTDMLQTTLVDGAELLLSVVVDGKPYPVDRLEGVLDTDHVDLTFDKAKGTVTSQRVYRKVDDGDFAAITPDLGAEDTSYVDTDVSADHLYSYYLVGVNGNGESLPSATVVVAYPPPEE